MKKKIEFNIDEALILEGKPTVGIFWFVPEKYIRSVDDSSNMIELNDHKYALVAFPNPLDEDNNVMVDVHVNSPLDHIEAWSEVVRQYPMLKTKRQGVPLMYCDIPRGRIIHNQKTRSNIVLVSPSMKKKLEKAKDAFSKLRREFMLPSVSTTIVPDEHYAITKF